MVVDCRNRIENITNKHMGNYVETMFYGPYDVEPSMIRKSQKNWKRCGTQPPSKLPGCLKTCTKFNTAILTNWATNYHEIQYENCNLIFHLPIVKSYNVFKEAGYIFRPKKDKLGLFMYSRGG